MSIKKDDIVNAIHSDGSDDSYYARSTGLGCVFRFQLDLSFFTPSDTDYKVVPGTFLHQDLIAPVSSFRVILRVGQILHISCLILLTIFHLENLRKGAQLSRAAAWRASRELSAR